MKRFSPVIRLFVSSTFSDLINERNALQELVFPKLEQLCEKNGFQFQAIDLRWGVSSEAGLDHRTMRICVDELQRAQKISPRPNFLILLGNRYGWRPLPEEISVDEFHVLENAAKQVETTTCKPVLTDLHAWYRKDENEIPPVYLLQSRQQQLTDAKDYTEDATWNETQAILWKIINHAQPQEKLIGRFDVTTLGNDSPPAIVRFQASATEQEIWYGALRIPDAHEHVLAFFRQIGNIDDFSEPIQLKDYVDLESSGKIDAALGAEQVRLKKSLRLRLGEKNIFTSAAQLFPACDVQDKPTIKITTDHLAQLCANVEDRLMQIVESQIEEYWNNTKQDSAERFAHELKIEQDEHERFGHEWGGANSFVGRENELNTILDYLQNDSPWPLVVHGTSGCGKTALLARAAQIHKSNARDQRSQVILRFIGVTPRSSNIRLLLGSLCQELRLRYPCQDKLPIEAKALSEELQVHLRSATQEQPLILFLDALDQLSNTDNGLLLDWIPIAQLPDHVKLVISCLSGRSKDDPASQPYTEFMRRQLPAQNKMNLDVLSENDARMLLFDRWLPHAERMVTHVQQERIERHLKSGECRQPMYLKLLFEEIRLWHSYDTESKLGESVSAILSQLIERLRQPTNHGLLVVRVLGYLTASRHGLTENEILEVLFADHDWKTEFNNAPEKTHHELPASAKRIPIAIWSRLRFDLAPYLTERAAPDANVLTFYHRQVAEWAEEHFLKKSDQNRDSHLRLAAYFRNRAEPLKDGFFTNDNRALTELLFHLVSNGQQDSTLKLMVDLRYLDARCSAGSVLELLDDYNLLENMNNELSESLRAFFHLHMQCLEKFPTSFFSLIHHEGPPLARTIAEQLVTQHLWKKPWLRTTEISLPLCQNAPKQQATMEPIGKWEFKRSCAVALACEPLIVFRLKRLGEIVIVDLNLLVELPQIISVRSIRPLAIFTNDDASHLVIAYENGEADVIALVWTSAGELSSQSGVTTIRYLIPELDTPVMTWHGNELLYQQDEQVLIRMNFDDLTSAPRRCELPHVADGELSCIVTIDECVIVSIRQGSSGKIACIGTSCGETVVFRQGTQALQVCACENSTIAVVWSDRQLCIYDTNLQLTLLSEVKLDNNATQLTWLNGFFLWFSSFGECHVWCPAEGPPYHTRLANNIISAYHTIGQIKALKAGTIIAVTDVGATSFRISFEGSSTDHALYAVFEPKEGQILAIQKRDDGAWLIDLAQHLETFLIKKDIRLHPECDSNGQYLLLSTSNDSVRIALDKHCVEPANLPKAINFVAGDPHGGFWLADRMGRIYRINDDGRCSIAATIPFNGVRNMSIRCIQNTIILSGVCESHQESGEDMAHAMLFYKRLESGGLELYGERIFKRSEGHIEAFDYTGVQSRLVVAIRKIEGFTHAFRIGTIEQFLDGTELLVPRPNTINIERLRISTDGEILQILCSDGAFIVMSLEKMHVEGILQPTISFTDMTHGYCTAPFTLLVAGQTKLFSYNLEK